MRESQKDRSKLAGQTYPCLSQTFYYLETRDEEFGTFDGVRHCADDREILEKFADRVQEACVW